MRSTEAMSILLPLQDQFTVRYYEWCLARSEEELEQDFFQVRRVKSSLAFLFLEFVEQHTRTEVRDLMTGGIKRFQQRAAALRGEPISGREEAIHQRFVDFFSDQIVIHGTPMNSFRVSQRERQLRDQELAGKLRFHQNKKSLRDELKRKFQTAGFKADREFSSGLQYCERLGDWYLMTTLDVSGRAQLSCSHSLSARRTIDSCATDLLSGANLLNWCGIHPTTQFDLITEVELEDVAESVMGFYRALWQSAPELLMGLHHNIPERLEDARSLVLKNNV